MVQLPWQEKLCYNLRISLQLVEVHLCNHWLCWKAQKTYHGVLQFTLIYKIGIQLLLLLLQGVQIFLVRNMKLTSGESYVLITKI